MYKTPNDELEIYKNKLMQNELNYNSCVDIDSKKYYFNVGYIYIYHLKQLCNLDVPYIQYIESSPLYSKILSIFDDSEKERQVKAAKLKKSKQIEFRLNQIENLVQEIRTILNK